MTHFMRYGILGALEVFDGDRRVGVDRPRRRAVLAFLLLHANRSVTTEQLVNALWEADPPHSARGQVHTAVSELRRVLGPDKGRPLASHHGIYRLSVTDSALDLAEFRHRVGQARRLAGSGDLREAAHTVRRSLEAWRGPALADITAPFADPVRAQLEEQRFAAHELLAELELGAGRHRELVPELTALLADHPTREGIAERLMLALYRSGRQIDALAVARSLRVLLVEEFGLDPGRSLIELEQAVLRADPSLAPPNGPACGPRVQQPDGRTGPRASGPAACDHGRTMPHAAPRNPVPAPGGPSRPGHWVQAPRPAQLPPHTAGFIGRGEQLAALDAVAGHAFNASRIALVSGPAGSGKTALAVRWAHRRTDSFPDGQLFADLRGGADDGQPAQVLKRFLIALGMPARQVPTSTGAREDLYRSCLAGRRVLVVLDNAHDYRQIRPLLPGAPSCLTVVTSRRMLSALFVECGATAIRVDALCSGQAVEALSRIVGPELVASHPRAARELARLCGGLPLALRIAGARLLVDQMSLDELVEELAAGDGQSVDLERLGDGSGVPGREAAHTYRRSAPEPPLASQLLGAHPG
ncbi:BTAD domain-containing putative transcriptional regulator [Kitasatospora sp. NPDC085879]|uniref:AfsR/SARP family transcriptional regulator n=1 Tax=Kitasatospora sp. NPDC085879 TaxID=3154769 RepID=UPI003420B093